LVVPFVDSHLKLLADPRSSKLSLAVGVVAHFCALLCCTLDAKRKEQFAVNADGQDWMQQLSRRQDGCFDKTEILRNISRVVCDYEHIWVPDRVRASLVDERIQ